MKTAVVILNWNTRSYLEAFLPRMLSSVRGEDAEVIVADSASTDGSREFLAERYPDLRTILLDANYGFTGGYNRAFDEILSRDDAPEYLVLVNSDIDVPDGWLRPLTGYLDKHPGCGVCGPKMHALLSEGGRFIRSSRFEYAGAAGGLIDRYAFPYCRGRVLSRTEQDEGQYDGDAYALMWVSGACLATRASLWRELGGLDERFFAHMEEIDYCWRAQLAGYGIRVVPQSCVYHLGGGTLPQSSPLKMKLNYRNSLLMLENNLPLTIGLSRARARIRTRLCIDRCAALAYLLAGKAGSFRAVRQAHREYRALSRKPSQGATAEIAGLTDICIIVQSVLHGNGIFKYLNK